MTQRERVLHLLRVQREVGCTTALFLRERLPRFSARIEELRKAGFCITSERLADSSWLYTLVHDAERDAERGSDLGTTRSLPASQAGVTLGAPTSGAPGAAASALKDAPPSVPVLAAPLFDLPRWGGYQDWEAA